MIWLFTRNFFEEGIAMGRKVCAIIGFGPGLGTAYAEIFKNAGYDLGLLSRSGADLGTGVATNTSVRAYECDAGEPDSIKDALASVQSELGPICWPWALCLRLLTRSAKRWSTPGSLTLKRSSESGPFMRLALSLIHISEPTRRTIPSRMPSAA